VALPPFPFWGVASSPFLDDSGVCIIALPILGRHYSLLSPKGVTAPLG